MMLQSLKIEKKKKRKEKKKGSWGQNRAEEVWSKYRVGGKDKQ